MIEKFVDPFTKQELVQDNVDNLYCSNGDGHQYICYDGCFDFVVCNNGVRTAREIYDDAYSVTNNNEMTIAAVSEQWHDITIPWRKTMMESLGKLSGKQILLLGNGASYKEFYFLLLGAHIVYTDLSLEAVRRAQDAFRRSEFWDKYSNSIEFHAVDATHLPFRDETFDIIYGAKFVGFIDDHPKLFSEISRCLKPNGICRFGDDAHSPLWDYAKRGLLRPIKKWIFRSPTSLDNLRARQGSGVDQQYIYSLMKQCGFRDIFFIREYFFLRIAQLCYGKLVRWNPKYLSYARPLFLLMKWVDTCLCKTSWMRKNYLASTWGLDK